MSQFHEIQWPVRVERDPHTPEGFRVYDDAARILLRCEDGTVVAVDEDALPTGYTHFSDRAEAARLRDAINQAGGP